MNVALLTAAGNGSRMHQDIPKQFITVDNKPIIIHTMEAFQKHPSIDAIICVTLESWIEVLLAYAKQFNITKLKWVIPGGKTGQESIRNGLNKLSEECGEDITVMIHDGNRPLVSSEIISDSLATYKKYGNAVAAIPCVEVIFESDDGKNSIKSIPREKVYRTQTPHTYKLHEILECYRKAEKLGISGTAASPILMEKFGKTTYFSKGSEENLKITILDDLKIFKAILHSHKENWFKE